MVNKKKTMKLFAGLASTILAGSALAGCSSTSNQSSPPSPPNIQGCSEWEWDDSNQQWVCDDKDFARQNGVSNGSFMYFYNGSVHSKSQGITSGSKSSTTKQSTTKSSSNKSGVSNGNKAKSGTKSNSVKSGKVGSGSKGGSIGG